MNSGGCRFLVEFTGRAYLEDPSAAHHGQAVGQRQGLLPVDGGVQHGHPDLSLQRLELVAQGAAQPFVLGAEGVVQQQHPGAQHQRPGQHDPLLLLGGELGRAAAGVLRHLDDGEGGADPRRGLGPARHGDAPRVPQAEGDVRGDVQEGEQGVAAEDRADGAAVGRHVGEVLAVKTNMPGRRFVESRDQPEGRGLAASGRTEKAEVLARPDRQIDAVNGSHVPEPSAQPDHFDLSAPTTTVRHAHPQISRPAVVRTGRERQSHPGAGCDRPPRNPRDVERLRMECCWAAGD
ncbi:hypothetical protein FRAHR75_350062 [Frankia sp. Hr75.2]|nr:hypothetical protein FRAHR75_350062 [Frankia sp. Hr75.2]